MARKSTAAEKIPAEYIECRTLAHAWIYTEVQRDGRDYVQGRECVRCRTRKWVRLSRFGEIKTSWYAYPRDYQVDGGVTQRDRNRMRIRAIEENDPAKNVYYLRDQVRQAHQETA